RHAACSTWRRRARLLAASLKSLHHLRTHLFQTLHARRLLHLVATLDPVAFLLARFAARGLLPGSSTGCDLAFRVLHLFIRPCGCSRKRDEKKERKAH